jgi:hypothetical protein
MNRELVLAKGEVAMAARYEENAGPVEVLASNNAALLLIDHQVG